MKFEQNTKGKKLHCFNCGKFELSTKICRNKKHATKQGSDPHEINKCDTQKWLKFSLQHEPRNVNCPVYQRETNMQRRINEFKIDRYEAIQMIKCMPSYANLNKRPNI